MRRVHVWVSGRVQGVWFRGATRQRMRELGCDTIQGYLFGRPLSYERANQMVIGLGNQRKSA